MASDDELENDYEDWEPKHRPLFSLAVKWAIAGFCLVIGGIVLITAVVVSQRSSREEEQRACYSSWTAKQREIDKYSGLFASTTKAIQEAQSTVKQAGSNLSSIADARRLEVKNAQDNLDKGAEELNKAKRALAEAEKEKREAKEALQEAKTNKSLEKAGEAVEAAKKELDRAETARGAKKNEADASLAAIEAEQAGRIKRARDAYQAAVEVREILKEGLNKSSTQEMYDAAKAEVTAARRKKGAIEQEAKEILAAAKKTHAAKLEDAANGVEIAAGKLRVAKEKEQFERAKITRDEQAAKQLALASQKVGDAEKAKLNLESALKDKKSITTTREETQQDRVVAYAQTDIAKLEKELGDYQSKINALKKEQAVFDDQSLKEWGVKAQYLADKIEKEKSDAIKANKEAEEETQRRMDRMYAYFFIAGIFGILVAYVVGVILLMAWVAKDCRARGVDGGAIWVLMILFGSWIVLIIYLAQRPYGSLVVCERCSNKRLMAALHCPHCGVRTNMIQEVYGE